ncbi:hypothetical protein ES879_17700 [Salmonella enterica]|nr:hypothetical protein [Salmonella enterica]ECT8129989.1 hypothetical protein [Salmonella enterica subsp. enterica serovar Javiana]EAN6178606.1 hypothetical protein [Salmonella enterica]EAN6254737.1 hypothetical protein [Salmonella enterica]EAN6344539.1 hypothetical protein [Salmonella enterica]
MPHALFIYKRGLGVYWRSASEATQGRSGPGQEEVRKSIHPVYTRHTSSFMCVGSELLGPSLGLAPSGLAQALFKTVNHFILQLELFREYAGRHKQ